MSLGEDMRQPELLILLVEFKMIQLHWKKFVSKMLNIDHNKNHSLHLPKRNENLYPHKYINVHGSLICNSLKLQTTKYPSMGECIKILWYIHTIE